VIKITILSGSSRPQNNTKRVSLALNRMCRERGFPTTFVDFENYDIPFQNQGELDINQLSEFQKGLVEGIEKAHLVFIVTPEYNWFPSAELVNMIHQLGNNQFKHLFDNRVFSFTGVSSGRGGRIPSIQLGYVIDKLINVFETEAITSPKKFESQFTMHVLDEAGRSKGNQEYDRSLTNYLEYTLRLTKRWFSL
jgi:NAD(P)H-dependent FMN reductase